MSSAHNCAWQMIDMCTDSGQMCAMNQHRLPPNYHANILETLLSAGYDSVTAEAFIDLDAAMFRWHRTIMKGEVPVQILKELGVDLELTHFSALTAIMRIQNGIGRDAEPATIGLLATEMNIDPSRASRIASDLINRGYLRREAAQDDGRKSILALTQQAIDDMTAFKNKKWSNIMQVFCDWSPEDIAAFSKLFVRYCNDARRVYNSSEDSGT